MNSEAYVGVDVSKDQLDLKALPRDEAQQFSNHDAGIKQLIDWVKKIDPSLIVFESTGGLEMLAVSSLLENALPVVVNPRQVPFRCSALCGTVSNTVDAVIRRTDGG